MTDDEVWASPTGAACTLEPRDFDVIDDDDFDGWYADFPGQRPPQRYVLVALSGDIIDDRVVHPVGGWTAYDAVCDALQRDGWQPPYYDPGTCEHGLSADLCSGPMHYPDDRQDW